MDHDDALRELERVRARERQATEQLALAEARLLEAERATAQLQVELAEARREVTDLGTRLVAAEASAAHFMEVNAGLMSSLSWRVTRPLRAAKQRLRP